MDADVAKNFVGVVGGSVGNDPFHRRCWSGSSYYFFTEIRRRGRLHRAFGVDVPRAKKYLVMAKTFRPNRTTWRKRYYHDPAYQAALTESVRRRLEPGDFAHRFLQLGCMYDVPQLVGGRSPCVSYSDSTLAEALRSPYLEGALAGRERNRALAYERQVYQGMEKVFTFSEYMRRSMVEDYGIPAERVVSIGGGINLDTIPEEHSEKDYTTREVLFIGIEFGRKGGWELLRSFKAVREKLPDAKLHIVGPRELSIPPGLEGGVDYHGFLDRKDPAGQARMDGLFRRCSLFVMPSRYEPFGIAPLEAMLYSIPCVVSRGWALPEIVEDGKTGLLAEVGSADDLAAKMTALLGDPDALRAMGKEGRRSVLERFTWSRVVDRLLASLAG